MHLTQLISFFLKLWISADDPSRSPCQHTLCRENQISTSRDRRHTVRPPRRFRTVCEWVFSDSTCVPNANTATSEGKRALHASKWKLVCYGKKSEREKTFLIRKKLLKSWALLSITVCVCSRTSALTNWCAISFRQQNRPKPEIDRHFLSDSSDRWRWTVRRRSGPNGLQSDRTW